MRTLGVVLVGVNHPRYRPVLIQDLDPPVTPESLRLAREAQEAGRRDAIQALAMPRALRDLIAVDGLAQVESWLRLYKQLGGQ